MRESNGQQDGTPPLIFRFRRRCVHVLPYCPSFACNAKPTTYSRIAALACMSSLCMPHKIDWQESSRPFLGHTVGLLVSPPWPAPICPACYSGLLVLAGCDCVAPSDEVRFRPSQQLCFEECVFELATRWVWIRELSKLIPSRLGQVAPHPIPVVFPPTPYLYSSASSVFSGPEKLLHAAERCIRAWFVPLMRASRSVLFRRVTHQFTLLPS